MRYLRIVVGSAADVSCNALWMKIALFAITFLSVTPKLNQLYGCTTVTRGITLPFFFLLEIAGRARIKIATTLCGQLRIALHRGEIQVPRFCCFSSQLPKSMMRKHTINKDWS